VRFGDFWRSAMADNIYGARFIMGMCLFWVFPLLLIAIGVMSRKPAIAWWAAVAELGCVLAWAVMLTRHFRSTPGTVVDLTPTVPLIVPAVLMVAGLFASLYSF